MDYTNIYSSTMIGIITCGLVGFLLGYVKGIMTKVKIYDRYTEENGRKIIEDRYIFNTVSVIFYIIIVSIFISKLKVRELPIYLIVLFAGIGIARIKKAF